MRQVFSIAVQATSVLFICWQSSTCSGVAITWTARYSINSNIRGTLGIRGSENSESTYERESNHDRNQAAQPTLV